MVMKNILTLALEMLMLAIKSEGIFADYDIDFD